VTNGVKILLAGCIAHGRRQFVDVDALMVLVDTSVWLSDFPVVPKRIDDRPHNHFAGCDSTFENGIRMVDSEYQPRCSAPYRLNSTARGPLPFAQIQLI
jgi:hypothetical protein